MEEEIKKFSTAEIVIGGLFTLGVDGVSALLDLVPIIGWMIATGVQAGTSFGTSFWLMSKGGKRAMKLERQLIKQISNILPLVPTTFTAFMIETALHNNPKLKKITAAKK